nr:hypothetical protein [Rhodococcus rhodnii]
MAVLVVVALVLVLVQPGPVAGLAIGLGGIALAIVAMGVVSVRMTRRAFPDDGDPGPASDEPGTRGPQRP